MDEWLAESLIDGIADASATFIDCHGRFFRTKTRDCPAVAALTEDFVAMAAVVDASCGQQFQHVIAVGSRGCCGDGDRLPGGKPTSSLIIDESSFARQGDRSVGMAGQWSGDQL